jgi:hypothetical protein
MSDKEITIIPETDSLPMLSDDSLLALADKAERQIDAIRKIKSIVIKVTNPQDWINQNDKPYLQASGAEKVARIFGIGWRIDEPILEFEPDGHFQYTYKGYFTLGGITIEAIGTRSSKDGFFKKYGKDKEILPPSEIDKGDVKKSAYTNLLGNGITRLLGIRNLTWEEVKVGGIDKSKSAKVDYKKKEDQEVQSDFTAKRQDHHRRIEETLNFLFGDDKAAKDAKLIELTTWVNKDGKTVNGSTNYLSFKNDQTVAILCSKLEKIANDQAPEVCFECHQPFKDGKCGCSC